MQGTAIQGVNLTRLGRYDMLCFEGISLMLNIFRGKTTSPNYRLAAPLSGELETITVHESVSSGRKSQRLRPRSHSELDFKGAPLRIRGNSAKYQVHQRTI